MFYWIVAIPLFIAIAMFSIYRPSNNQDLKQTEDMQASTTAFRMAIQHDAVANAINEAIEKEGAYPFTIIGDGYDFSAIGKSAVSAGSTNYPQYKYFTNNFVPDFNNIQSLAFCATSSGHPWYCNNGVDNTGTAVSVNIITFLDNTKALSRYWQGDHAFQLYDLLSKYNGAFPIYRTTTIVNGKAKTTGPFYEYIYRQTCTQPLTFASQIIKDTTGCKVLRKYTGNQPVYVALPTRICSLVGTAANSTLVNRQPVIVTLASGNSNCHIAATP